jgi:GAF domain-containing protein
MMFIVGVLLGIATIVDVLFMEDFPWIDVAWAIPIVTAAFVLTPLEVAGVGLTASFLSLGSQVAEETGINFWTSSAVGISGLLVAVIASLLKRHFSQVNVIRNALEESPLAYAEFSFPGYRLLNSNKFFQQVVQDAGRQGAALHELLPETAAEAMAAKMDEAVTARARVDCDELHMPTTEGGSSFWSMNFIPIVNQGRGTPRAVALFAVETTDTVNRARTREAALRISAAVMSSLSLNETIRVVLDNLAFIAGTDSGALLLLEDDQWVGMAGYGKFSDDTVTRVRYPYEDIPAAVAAVESKKAIAAENPREDSRFIPERLDSFNIKSSLIVPLVSANRSIGVVCLSRTEMMSEFTDEQINFATVIGSHAALAIENATIYENEHYIRKSLEAIEAISEAGLVSLDLEEVLIELVTRAQDVMQMDAAMILLADDTGEELVARAAAGNLALPLSEIRTRIGVGLAGRAFKEGVPMKVDNIKDHPEALELCPFAENSGVQSVLAVPLRLGGKIAGVMQIGSQRERAFSSREWGLIQVLADRASMALQNSLLHETIRKELTRVALLRDVASACASSQDIRKIAEQALRAVHEQMGCFRASLYYLDRNRNGLVSLAFTGHSPKVMDEFKFSPLDRGTLLTRAVLERRMITHEEVNISNATESEAYILKALDVGENRRCTLPIIYKDEVVGGMALVWPDKRPFTPRVTETVLSIANQLAVAIHSCEFPDENEPALAEARPAADPQ